MTRIDQQVEALDRILLLTTILDDDMTRGLEKVGLSQSRVRPVWLLHQNGPSTQRELAEALGVSARNVTGLVDALVETGFVRRGPHPTDRRATLVSLTAQGRRVADGLAAGRESSSPGSCSRTCRSARSPASSPAWTPCWPRSASSWRRSSA